MNLLRNRLIVIIILALLVAGGFWFLKSSRSGIQTTADRARSHGEQEMISATESAFDPARTGGEEQMTSPPDRKNPERIQRPTPTAPAVPGRHELLIGEITFPVIFQDTTQPVLSEAERSEVIADFQMIYGHLDLSQTYDISSRVMTAGGKEITISKMVYATGPGQHFPEAHMNTFGLLTGEKENYQLVVPSKLITAYRSAFDFRKANQEAFARLDSFLPLGDPGPPQTSGMSPSDLIWTRTPSILTPEMEDRILKETKQSRFRRPGILEYFKVMGDENSLGLPGLPGGTIVGTAMQVKNGNIPKQPVVLVYIDGRWKIGIAPFGT